MTGSQRGSTIRLYPGIAAIDCAAAFKAQIFRPSQQIARRKPVAM
jgi:hypothetical protein